MARCALSWFRSPRVPAAHTEIPGGPRGSAQGLGGAPQKQWEPQPCVRLRETLSQFIESPGQSLGNAPIWSSSKETPTWSLCSC